MKAFLACWCAALLSLNVHAGDIAIFSGDGSPPKMYQQDGKNMGILVDILRYADQQLHNDTVHLELFPWARAYVQASAGRGGILSLSWTQRRDELFDYSVPLYVDEVVIVVRKGQTFPFKTLADLKGKRVGLVRGATFGEEFQQAMDSHLFDVEGDNGVENRISKLMLGRVDCALFNSGKAGFEETLRLNKALSPLKDELVVLPVPLRNDPNYLAFPKEMHMQAWLGKFNEVIRRGYAQGDIQKIVARNLHSQ